MVIVGNTCMHHLLLGIDPSHVGLAPYAPVMRHATTLAARDVPLKIAPEARVCLLPLVAGFVGADAVAVTLATRLADGDALRIAVDIGTNGEVILGSRARLMACSAPAGPAPAIARTKTAAETIWPAIVAYVESMVTSCCRRVRGPAALPSSM